MFCRLLFKVPLTKLGRFAFAFYAPYYIAAGMNISVEKPRTYKSNLFLCLDQANRTHFRVKNIYRLAKVF